VSDQASSNSLKYQYAAQVDADLESLTKEQERVTAEISVLQARLEGLREDYDLLLSVRAALGDNAAATAGPAEKTGPAKAVKTVPKQAKSKPAETPAHTRPTDGPTLASLVLDLLSWHSERRSVGEIAQEVRAARPERPLSDQVVRNALNSLVAKSKVERHVQGRSVFYSAVPQKAPRKAPRKASQKVAQEESAASGE
jgi:predicted transcriptional regulator